MQGVFQTTQKHVAAWAAFGGCCIEGTQPVWLLQQVLVVQKSVTACACAPSAMALNIRIYSEKLWYDVVLHYFAVESYDAGSQ